MSEKQYPSERKDRYIVRLPDGMRDKIKDVATGGRSMNDIIVAALEQYFRLEEEREAGWRWVKSSHQIDPEQLAAVEYYAEELNLRAKAIIFSALEAELENLQAMEIGQNLSIAMTVYEEGGGEPRSTPPIYARPQLRTQDLSSGDLELIKNTISVTLAQELERIFGKKG